MKKQLLLSGALLSMFLASAQNSGNRPKPNGYLNLKSIKESYYKMDESQVPVGYKKLIGPDYNPVQSANTTDEALKTTANSINWKLLCGSMNCYGQLVSQSRPLQYNDNVNAVSLIHRKSTTYSTTVNSNPGTIVAEISSNWGTNWDSTCIYASADAGRYPQGAIYAGPGNSNIANAYVVGSGPTVNNNAFTGNWYASKKLAAAGSTLYNNIPDPTPNAQQFLAFNLPSYPANQKPHGWSRYGFSATDDGVVRSLALVEDDLTGLSTMRGVMVVKGTFNAGVFTWTTDSLIPNCVLDNSGSKQIFSAVQMAWNESGTVGYVVIPGALNSATGSNRGFQPIIYKTTNSGNSWALTSGIDFNAPAMSVVLDHIASTASNPTLAIPCVFGEYDITVDANNKLHIGTTLMSTFSPNDDSLGFVGNFTNGGENYNWKHTPGNRPYLYDFIGDGTAAWNVVFVDSMSSEGPSSSSTGDGYNDNPWDPTGTGGAKIEMGPRIQLGRTPDGQYITFSWVESDTNYTSSAKKWNNLPDIKARLMSVGSGTSAYQVAATEQNVTQYPSSVGPANPQVITRATLHYMSPTTGSAAVQTCTTGGKEVIIKTPFSITNSNPYSQLTNNTTWYTTASLSYTFGLCPTSLSELSENVLDHSMIYPNPAKNATNISLEMKEKGSLNISIYNIVGQEIRSFVFDANVGANSIPLDLTSIHSGVYMVKIQSGNLSSTKKLIIE